METAREGWLVVAHFKGKNYPTFTVPCETAEEAIAIIRSRELGFCFSKGEWSFGATKVAIVERAQAATG